MPKGAGHEPGNPPARQRNQNQRQAQLDEPEKARVQPAVTTHPGPGHQLIALIQIDYRRFVRVPTRLNALPDTFGQAMVTLLLFNQHQMQLKALTFATQKAPDVTTTLLFAQFDRLKGQRSEERRVGK